MRIHAESANKFEDLIAEKITSDLVHGFISVTSKTNIGFKPDEKPFTASFLLTKQDPIRKAVVLAKYQDFSGSTQEKIVYDFIKLSFLAEMHPEITKLWLIIGGNGWNDSFIKFLDENISDWVPRIPAHLHFVCNHNDFMKIDFSNF